SRRGEPVRGDAPGEEFEPAVTDLQFSIVAVASGDTTLRGVIAPARFSEVTHFSGLAAGEGVAVAADVEVRGVDEALVVQIVGGSHLVSLGDELARLERGRTRPAPPSLDDHAVLHGAVGEFVAEDFPRDLEIAEVAVFLPLATVCPVAVVESDEAFDGLVGDRAGDPIDLGGVEQRFVTRGGVELKSRSL